MEVVYESGINQGGRLLLKKKWQSGDVIGCAIDLDERSMDFYLNGIHLGRAFSEFDIGEGLSPAASFSQGQILDFNFGGKPFEYGVPSYEGLTGSRTDPNSPHFLLHFPGFMANYHFIQYLKKRNPLPSELIQRISLKHRSIIESSMDTLKLRIHNVDNPAPDQKHGVENLLIDDKRYFSTDRKNVHIVFTSPHCPFILKNAYIEARKGPNPVKTAMVFVTETPPDLSQLSTFDNFTRQDYEKWVQLPDTLSIPQPRGFLEITPESLSANCKLDPPVTGSYITLKLIQARDDRPITATRRSMQVNYVAFFGTAGSANQYHSSKIIDLVLNPNREIQRENMNLLEALSCNNDYWSLEMDQQLTDFLTQTATRFDIPALRLSEGQIVANWRFHSGSYPALQSINIDSMIMRFHILWFLNHHLNCMLFFIDLTKVSKEGTIAHALVSLKG